MTITANNSMENWKKNIILFLSSQTISLFGSSLVQYAIMWYVTLSTQSGIMMTIFILCGFIPTFLLSPFAGVWADRYNRKVLMIVSDSLIALSTLILAIIFLMGYDSMWLLFVVAAIRALGTGVQTPAVGAVLPQIVPEEHLVKINGINGSIQAIIMFVSPMVSAALLSTTAIEVIFFVDVITAAIAVGILLLFIRIPTHAKAAQSEKVSYFKDFQLGLKYISNNSFLKVLFIMFAVFFVLMAPAAFLTPLQVARSFGDDVWRLTAIEIAFSIGMMAGGGVIATWGGFKNRIHTMAFSGLIMGICTVALGIVPSFWIYLLFMGIFGIAMPIFNTPTTVLIQEKVDGDYLGRVFGVFGMISTSMMPIGMLIFGPIADVIAIEWLLIGTGLVMMFMLIFLIKSKTLIEAGNPKTSEVLE
ncbi:MFS transporter [Ureibacillus massiliensis 4400831 = CIP 108448 = CCUG 49529]|uniref:MFS transporter n=2 Tax=cellular organisms TaxID=131567 RepID=A0A0A3J408_9BACL|nr:MFS transporter [Ureibacillus massiliensis]KGR91759.1 MFS transporter [Ureibacillus massiliensis 4400831 = CIP 108448 = CCUG 49529]